MTHWQGCPADDERVDRDGTYCGICGSTNTRTRTGTMVGTTRPTGRATDGEPLDRESVKGLTDMPQNPSRRAARQCNVTVRPQADSFRPRLCHNHADNEFQGNAVCSLHFQRLTKGKWVEL